MRKYALTKIEAGVYLCPSNDADHLYRFRKYEDGRHHGLDVDYDLRPFWAIDRAPLDGIDDGGYVDLEEIPFVEIASWLPTRRAALDHVFGTD